MDAEQGEEMIRIINPDHTMPVHFDDYDVFTSPLSDFQREVEASGLSDRVDYLNHGDSYSFAVS